jgi:hypothetical protein
VIFGIFEYVFRIFEDILNGSNNTQIHYDVNRFLFQNYQNQKSLKQTKNWATFVNFLATLRKFWRISEAKSGNTGQWCHKFI